MADVALVGVGLAPPLDGLGLVISALFLASTVFRHERSCCPSAASSFIRSIAFRTSLCGTRDMFSSAPSRFHSRLKRK